MELCRFLRWKSYYALEVVTPSALAEQVSRNEVPYSCLRTCQSWGPDDEVAAPEACGSDRPCFEPSKRLTTTSTRS